MKHSIAFVILAIVFFIYLPWFHVIKSLSSGDWPYLFLENIQAFKIPTEPPFLWLEPYYQITAKLGVQVFSLSWEVTEKIFWFFPYLIISLVSSYLFLKYLATLLKLEKNSLAFITIGSLIFTTNTYILILVGGGQMGVAMGYSLAPLVLLQLMKIINLSNSSSLNFKFFIVPGFIMGVQLMFDPRIFLLSIFIGSLYFLFMFKNVNLKIFKRIIFVLIFAVVTNLFWILPNFGYFDTEYKVAIDAVNADFLSFATFSNSISLLHPNWPDNVFGKVGFMKSEFILLAILAYSSLLMISNIKNQKSNKTILFFAFLGLFGVFLAKGTNPPFGELYVWLSNVPGFSIFRDPTKFYTLVIISYMILIPFSLYKLSEKVSGIKYKVLSIFFVVFWLITIHPAVSGDLTGTFKPREVPGEYIELKDFLNNHSRYFKALWVPQVERFGFSSKNHPAISSTEFFKVSSLSGVLKRFEMHDVKSQLKEKDIRYIIVPYDYLGEIFLTDRKYDDRLYIETVNKLKNTNWVRLLENNQLGRIKVFEVTY